MSNFQSEIYISKERHNESLFTIHKHAKIFSTRKEYDDYRPKRKRKIIDPDLEAVYYCPEAAEAKVGRFEFNWNEWYKGPNTDFKGIIKYINTQIASLKQKRQPGTRVTFVYPQSLS
jgi:hypothetical protein